MNMMELLRNHSVFWSKLGFCYDPPRLGKDGKPIVFFDNWKQVKKYHRDFYNAGIRFHTSILFTGWTGVNQYDYELTDKVLNTIFSCGENLLYIPRIKLNVPLEWERENPEELCVYYCGPREKEAIRALVGTPKHDLLGYQSPRGYYTAGGWQDDRPNVGGVIGNQSFSSQKWLRDAGEALRRLIRRIEDGPYGNRVPAYHIAYGASGESCLWGRCNVHDNADYGITNRKAFFDWGMKKYGSLEALREAWHQPFLARENAEVPPPSRKEGAIRNMNEFMRSAPEDRICTDYDLFMSDVNMDAMEHFGKIVKKETNGKPVGAFYGYFLEVARSTYTGYNGIERFMKSPWVDFIAAPKREGGGEMSVAQSINRSKLWMDELDNRTFLANGVGIEYKSSGLDETKAIMWREAAKNLSHGSSFWWMDLGGGWYDSPDLLAEIARIEKTSAKIRGRKRESISEVLLVADEEAFHYHKTSYYLHRRLFADVIDSMNRVGAPYDLYRMNDLETLDLTPYKLILFLNPFRVQSGQWKRISARFPENVTLLWNYAPGMILDDVCKAENIGIFTGFEVAERADNPYLPLKTAGALQGTSDLVWAPHIADDVCPVADNCPVFEITGPAAVKPLAFYENGGIAAGEMTREKQRIIYTAVPLFKTEHLRKLMEQSQCKCLAPVNTLVYGDSRFIAVFAWAECHFMFSLPPAKWREAVSGNCREGGSRINVKLKANEIKLWIREDDNE